MDDRPILDIDRFFLGWDNSSVAPIQRRSVLGSPDTNKPTMTGVIRNIISIDVSFKRLPRHAEYDFDVRRILSLLDNIEVGLHHDINCALRELDEVHAEASENALPIPSALVHDNARILIPKLHRIYTQPLSVYPLLDGEIAIEATVASRDSVLISCEPDGSILCLVNIHRRSRRAKYDRVSDLPDAFIHKALTELKELAR